MTEEQKKIKQLIDMFHGSDDYHNFKTAEEYFIFRENRAKMLLIKEIEISLDMISKLVDTGNKISEDWISAFNKFSIAIGPNSNEQYKLFADKFKENKIPPEVQLPLFVNIYINSNVKFGYCKYFTKSFDNYPTTLKEKLRNKIHSQIKIYEDEDGYFTVYRGEYISTNSGSSIKINQAISFTFDYEKALFFACRYMPEKANIYTAKVSLDSIIYYTDARNEKEVLVRPENMGGKFLYLKCKEVNPEEYYKRHFSDDNIKL